MAGRREPNRDEGLGFWGGLAAAAAVGVGIAAVVSAALASKDEDERKSYTPKMSPGTSGSIRRVQQKYKRLVLAVDATPKRGGALLIMPDSRQIHYYSVDWTAFFNFSQLSEHQQPEKFELTNAVLAMTVFGPCIEDLEYEEVIVKFDNTVVNSKHLVRDSLLLRRARELIGSIKGNWEVVSMSNDKDMRLADKLSRTRLNEYSDQDQFELQYPGFTAYDYSDEIISEHFEQVRPYVPAQFHQSINQ